MMRRVIKIGDIVLDHKLYIKEEFAIRNVEAKTFNTISGGMVIYESVKRNNGSYYTLISYENGWQKEITLKNILSLANDIDVKTTITFDDNSIENVRFAYEKGEVIKAEPIFENSDWFKVEIATCRI
jgi:hypothetical protein